MTWKFRSFRFITISWVVEREVAVPDYQKHSLQVILKVSRWRTTDAAMPTGETRHSLVPGLKHCELPPLMNYGNFFSDRATHRYG